MLKRPLWWIAEALSLLMLIASGAAKADTVYVNGSFAFSDNGNGIPPYGGTLNGQSESFYCVDFSTPIWGGESWQVNITSLSGSDFSHTRLGNKTTYLEMAWLITQMLGATTNSQKAMFQYAIWSFTGGPNPYNSNSALIAAALAAVEGGFNGQGWEILTPTGSAGQEFLVFVSEPGEFLMLLIGLGVLVFVARGKRATQPQTI